MRASALALASTILMAVSVSVSASDQALRDKAAEAGLQALPTEMQQPANNPITPEKIELGRMLFFDPRISASGLISCNTCHNVGTGGDDNLPTSVGHGWQKGPRNAPTVFNAVFNVAQFWDGRAEDLKEQAQGTCAGWGGDGQQARPGRHHAEEHARVRGALQHGLRG